MKAIINCTNKAYTFLAVWDSTKPGFERSFILKPYDYSCFNMDNGHLNKFVITDNKGAIKHVFCAMTSNDINKKLNSDDTIVFYKEDNEYKIHSYNLEWVGQYTTYFIDMWKDIVKLHKKNVHENDICSQEHAPENIRSLRKDNIDARCLVEQFEKIKKSHVKKVDKYAELVNVCEKLIKCYKNDVYSKN